MSVQVQRTPASFRDPSGFLYTREGRLLRQVQSCYAPDYTLLRESGLWGELTSEGLLVPADEVDLGLAAEPGAHVVLEPERVRFISHAYEWSFGMLRDAGLLTLEILERALDRGMVLKDAPTSNIQFHNGRPVLIDSLSFERYVPGEPWIAYAQFCRHFVAPLALMAGADVRLVGLLREHLDGIPLELAAKLLPWKSRLSPGLLAHLHLHSTARPQPGAHSHAAKRKPELSEAGLHGLIRSLHSTLQGLTWQPIGTEWADYYADTNYSEGAATHKAQTLSRWLGEIATRAQTCWDLGANNGRYSRLAVEAGLWTLAVDVDPAAVEQAYRHVRANLVQNLHPLLNDLRNPSPDQGWIGQERVGFFSRGPGDVALALALVHHLAIGNNVPLRGVWECLMRCGREILVEWVPKEDSQVQRMLGARRDIFEDYCESEFLAAMPTSLKLVAREPVRESGRVLLWVCPK